MKTAMILAAGRGERLKPLTNTIPKALCKVHDIPLIEHHVSRLALAGFDRLVINHAWLGGKIRQHLGNGSQWGIEICYAPEPPGGLETGGGIVNALPLLGNGPFLTVNADIFTDFDFAAPTIATLLPDSLVHLILIKKPNHLQTGDFGLSSTQRILNDENSREYTFSGIAYYSPIFFSHLKPGRYSITPLLRQCATAGRATGTVYSGKWVDIGSPTGLELARL